MIQDIEKNEKEMDEREREMANRKKWSLEDDDDDDDMEEREKNHEDPNHPEQVTIGENDADGEVKMDDFDPLEEFMAAEVLPKMEEDVKKALYLEEKEEQNAIKDGRIADTRSVQVPDAKTDKKKEVDPYDSDLSDLWFMEEEDEEDDEVNTSIVFLRQIVFRNGSNGSKRVD